MERIENDWRLKLYGELKVLQFLLLIGWIIAMGMYLFDPNMSLTGTQGIVITFIAFVVMLIFSFARAHITLSIARDKIKQWLSEFRTMADGEVKVFEDQSQVVVNVFHRELQNSGIPHVPDLRGGTTVKVTRAMDSDGTAS